MTANKPKTRAEKRIAAAPAEAFRKLTKPELQKLGLSLKSERFIEIDRRLTKNAKTLSKRLFIIKKTGSSPEALVEARAESRILYKSRETKEAAEKQKTTRGKQREKKLVEKSLQPLTSKQIERAAADTEKRIATITRVRPGPNSKKSRASYRPTQHARDSAPDNVRRKLSGEWVPDGEWQPTADLLRASNSPYLGRFLQSKPGKTSPGNEQPDDDLMEAA